MQRKNVKYTQGDDFELIENLPTIETKQLLLFDEPGEKKFKF